MTGRIDQNGVVEWSEEDQCFIGSCPGIIGPCCHGDDEDEVYRGLRQIISEWLEIEEQDATATHSAQQPFIETYTPTNQVPLIPISTLQLGGRGIRNF